MDSDLFAQLPPTKLFFRCAVPAVVTSVFGALYSVVDGLFVGRFLGEDALAAINLIMPVIMIVESLSNMIATGASVNISMLLGKRRRDEASRVFSFSVLFILLLSCALGVTGYFFARPFITLLAPGASENAIAFSAGYLRVYALFAPLIPIYFATDNYLRVCGRQTLSMWIGVVTQGLNVALDFVLIAVLHLGVRAAAAAAFLFMLLAGPSVASVFIKPGDTELAAVSKTAIRIFSFSYLAGWIDMCFSSYFTALDRPARSLLVSFFGTLVFPIVFLFVLSALWGLYYSPTKRCNSLWHIFRHATSSSLTGASPPASSSLPDEKSAQSSVKAFYRRVVLNGVWFMAAAASVASGILSLSLSATLKLEPARAE